MLVALIDMMNSKNLTLCAELSSLSRVAVFGCYRHNGGIR